MKRLISIFSAILLTMTLIVARQQSYGPVTLNYDTSTQANSAGVAQVIVMWDARNAYGINIVGAAKVEGQEKSFVVSGSNGKHVITFRNLVPYRNYYVEWEFIEPSNFPSR